VALPSSSLNFLRPDLFSGFPDLPNNSTPSHSTLILGCFYFFHPFFPTSLFARNSTLTFVPMRISNEFAFCSHCFLPCPCRLFFLGPSLGSLFLLVLISRYELVGSGLASFLSFRAFLLPSRLLGVSQAPFPRSGSRGVLRIPLARSASLKKYHA